MAMIVIVGHREINSVVQDWIRADKGTIYLYLIHGQ